LSGPAIRFAFGVHIHQPVGNFDHVFQQHVDDVYLPFLRRVVERGLLPLTLHVSGPLLEWMEAHDGRVLDLIGPLVADGRIELLLSGLYEPVLAALPCQDRREQIGWMRETLARLFGVQPTGLWLTERVWEPDLASDLARSGVRFALVDDRHFLVTGFERDQLHAPYWTEHDGSRLALFPIDERLRYLVPFRPPSELAAYLRDLRNRGHRLAVLADDGEKFGGWPGTSRWLYEEGWLDAFLDTMDELRGGDEMVLTTLDGALETVGAAGPAYLPSTSYREMEAWSLPTPAAVRLEGFERDLKQRLEGPDGAFVRGSHWKNFLVKYRESNRMHQKMLHLSALCRERGDPPAARRAIGRAQCNDAYWHGVFGGLYLKHLRDAIWSNLAEAEAELRNGESLRVEPVDFDADGHPELWVHSSAFSAVVNPARGGAVEELTVFRHRLNFANALTRRREPYHFPPKEPEPSDVDQGGTPSIHHTETASALDELPPVDAFDRALFVERIVALGADGSESGATALRSWAAEPLLMNRCQVDEHSARIVLVDADGDLEKALTFDTGGRLQVDYSWDECSEHADAYFAVELSFGDEPVLEYEPPPAHVWTNPIQTVSRTEDGLTESRQGTAVTLLWPVSVGRATVRVLPKPRSA